MSGTPSFQEIPAWSAEQVRGRLREDDPKALTLLDVRQPEEYAEGHLPGAMLIPVGELHARIEAVPRADKPTIVYCRSGMRAGRAVAILLQAGFRDVWNMTGGILAWNGMVATGAPEAVMSWFPEDGDPAAVVSLAWILECGAQVFYERMARTFTGSGAGELFRTLTEAEEQHKNRLKAVHASVTGIAGDPVGAREVEERDTMEGGMSIRRALEWAEGRKALDVLELAVAMEVNAFDRYQRAARMLRAPESRKVLERLAQEEKEHLDRLLESFVEHGRNGFLA